MYVYTQINIIIITVHLQVLHITTSFFFVKSRWKGSDQEAIQSNSTSCPKHQTGKELAQLRHHKMTAGRAENQEDNSFPADSHKAILNKVGIKSKTNRKRTNIDN